jgi:hypothetical protein
LKASDRMDLEKIRTVFTDECEGELIPYDVDWVHINCGDEGAGKSTLAMKLCQMANPNFGIDDITLGYDEFTHRLDTAPQGSAILCDEGGDVFLSRESLGKPRASSLKQLMKIRAKNFFVVINISDISLLEHYLKTFRLKSLTRVKMYYRNRIISKGHVEFYIKEQARRIYKDSQGNIKFPKPADTDRFDRFPADDPLWVAYSEKSGTYKKLQEKQRAKARQEHPIKKYFEGYKEVLKSEMIKRIGKDQANPYRLIRNALTNRIVSETQRGKLTYLTLLT